MNCHWRKDQSYSQNKFHAIATLSAANNFLKSSAGRGLAAHKARRRRLNKNRLLRLSLPNKRNMVTQPTAANHSRRTRPPFDLQSRIYNLA